jgi:hypothetical protein
MPRRGTSGNERVVFSGKVDTGGNWEISQGLAGLDGLEMR